MPRGTGRQAVLSARLHGLRAERSNVLREVRLLYESGLN